MPIPDRWASLTMRLRMFAEQECIVHEVNIVTVQLVVSRGRLVQWTEPVVRRVEPKGSAELLSMLTDNSDSDIVKT
jgi:hypothetical protein